MSISGLVTAVQFLTRLPVPKALGAGTADLHEAAPWFPFVGLLVGAVVAVATWAGADLGPWPAGLLGVIAWVVVTGALHLDGLGDVADGLGAAHGSPERFLEVIRDPHSGSFGVTAIVLQIAAKLVLLAELTQRSHVLALALVLVAAWARWGSLVLARGVPPLGAGFAKRFAGAIGVRMIGAWALVLTLASVVIAPVLVAAVVVPFVLAIYWRQRLGGITGDCHGASIEVTETVLLALLVATAG
jgi:adenosylcobinamide-GDP ribazoletransferase